VKDADFVDRSRIASLFNLQGIQAELDALNDLSENISTVTDAFQLHFKTAGAIDPTVKTQFEALKKSRSGLDKAKAIRQNVQELAQLYPQDKTAQRALADAETMVKRYVNHVNDCRNMIMTLSKKQMPASLKKMAKAVEDGIKARLVDPSVLDVTPWQDSFEDFNSSTSQRGACFQVDFRVTITRNDGTNYTVEISLAESTVRLTGPFIKGDYQYKPTTAKAVIEAFLEKLKGYPGLKGESDKNAARAPIAAAVKAAVRKVCARLASYGVDDVTVSNDNRFIEGAYQSDLPKYGPEGFDEWLYDDMVKRVFKETDDAIKRELTPYMGSIKKSNISVEEKGWIYIRVELN
jgi:hypothetical protein